MELMQVAFFLLAQEITQVKEAIHCVRCASGNVFRTFIGVNLLQRFILGSYISSTKRVNFMLLLHHPSKRAKAGPSLTSGVISSSNRPCRDPKLKQQHFWPPMTLIQKYFPPEEIAEARKWTILRPALVTVTSAIRRPPAATSDEQSPAAPPCPPSLPACRDFSTWASNRDL